MPAHRRIHGSFLRFLWAFLLAAAAAAQFAGAQVVPPPAEPYKLQQIPPGSSVKGTAFQLNLPDRVHWPYRPQKEVGWCGEAALQQAMLYHGGFFPQKMINECAKPAHPDLYGNDIPVALDELGLRAEFWPGDAADLPLFLDWLRYQIRGGVPFSLAKINPTQHPEWPLDHFMLATGIDTQRLLLNTTWGRQEWCTFEQLSAKRQGFAFANPFNMYYGIAITGPAASGPGAVPVRLAPMVEEKKTMRLLVICEKLAARQEYVVYKTATYGETPRPFAAFTAASAAYAFYDAADPRQSVVYQCYAKQASPPAPDVTAASRRADRAVAEKLAGQLPNVDWRGRPLADALEYIGDASGVTIVAEAGVLEAAGFDPAVRVDARMQRPSAATLLWSILLQTKGRASQQLGYRIIDGKVVVRGGNPDGTAAASNPIRP